MDFIKQAAIASKSKTSLIIEITLLVALNIGCYLLFQQVDLLEKIYQFSRSHEHYELDELVPLLFTITLSLLIFSIRRRRENKNLQYLFDELSVHDYATGLFNRKYFLNIATTELERRYRNGSELSVILLQFDNFEEFDNTLSKITAEQAMADVAKIVRTTAREIDLAARWSEDEIALLCRDTKLAGATRLAEKILDNFHTFRFPEFGQLTASIGVASSLEEKDPIDLVHRAEINMKKAVSRGKNQIVAAVA